MNLFDRFIDSFSAHELRLRVRGVILFGLAVCIATAVGGVAFMATTFTCRVEGSGALTSPESRSIELQIARKDTMRLHSATHLSAEFVLPSGNIFRTATEIRSIDPQTGLILLDAGEVPPEITGTGRFRMNLILYEKPYWQFLWGADKEDNAGE
ncbi:MAG: hypothetical protein V2A66_06385 [Pseudomonadota bacterium]